LRGTANKFTTMTKKQSANGSGNERIVSRRSLDTILPVCLPPEELY